METFDKDYSFAVFPFLKTSGKVSIGGLTFRSTADTEGLSREQAESLHEISDMLFLQDNLRIKSASYSLIPLVDLSHSPVDIKYLMNIQAVVAYCYALPRHEFCDLFLSSDYTSIAIFTPGKVPLNLVHPDFYDGTFSPTSNLETDKTGQVDGYSGLYNFKHHFWVARGSRLYGPRPQIILNYSQDLCVDIPHFTEGRTDYRLLFKLLGKSDTVLSLRVFTALRWFNEANNESNGQMAAIVNLSIAFEALLSLPVDEKTNRLIDAISLLLGRTPRLDIWVRQFYDARSSIIHEGHTQQLRFVATDSKKISEGQLYQSLLSYGRQIFQLCLGTLLTGAELAESAGLEEKLVTNQERFKKICMILNDEKTGATERLECIAPIVAAIKQYRYVAENALQIDTMLGATRLAVRILMEQIKVTSKELREQLKRFSTAERTKDHFPELDALAGLHKVFKDIPVPMELGSGESVRDLVDVVWNYVFMHYFWIKGRIYDKG